MNKQGNKIQSGSPAATLIGLITIIFVFYIIFLPPDARKELLNDDEINKSTDDSTSGNVLLSSQVGSLDYRTRNQFDHPLPNMFLVAQKSAAILLEETGFQVSKGVFGEDKKVTRFAAQDVSLIDDVLLNFQAAKHSGVLGIIINGRTIFEGEITSQNPPPIKISKSVLEELNTIEFYATGGWFEKK